MSDSRGADLILLDACCVLNLYSTRRMEEILVARCERFGVVERVAAESLYVLRGGSGEDAAERDPVDLQQAHRLGILERLDLETEDESRAYVDFAAELDDGEAMTCALAIHRGAAIATDDRKARRVLRNRAPEIGMHSTTELIKAWSDSQQISVQVLRQVLTDIRQRGCFMPSSQDPLLDWWIETLR